MEADTAVQAGQEERDPPRELSGEKAVRIVDAMRRCVAERGITGATFEHVSREAGVSRGLLHYYFGTKERLLAEVVRRDAEIRVARLDEPLAPTKTPDDVLEVLLANLQESIDEDPGFWILIFELFTAGQRNPDIRKELAELFNRTRDHVAEILSAKESEGVVSLRFDVNAIVGYLFALADGIALQALSDPGRDQTGVIETSTAAARYLLTADA
jgi:AcrR family transcriptional regulator